MNIAIKPVGSGAYTTLIDDTLGGVIGEIRWKGELKVQDEALCAPPGALSAQYRQPLGNVKGVFPVTNWVISYATMDTALAGLQAVPASVLGTKVHIRVTVGATVVYYPNAVATALDGNMQGGNVTFNGSFTTDAGTTVLPAN